MLPSMSTVNKRLLQLKSKLALPVRAILRVLDFQLILLCFVFAFEKNLLNHLLS